MQYGNGNGNAKNHFWSFLLQKVPIISSERQWHRLLHVSAKTNVDRRLMTPEKAVNYRSGNKHNFEKCHETGCCIGGRGVRSVLLLCWIVFALLFYGNSVCLSARFLFAWQVWLEVTLCTVHVRWSALYLGGPFLLVLYDTRMHNA